LNDRWKDGLSLEEALLETTAPALRGEIERLRKYDAPIVNLGESDDSPKWQFRRLWADAADDLIEKLRKGELFATGYLVGATSDLSAKQIPADRWRILEPNFAESSAQDKASRFIGIRVFRNVPKELVASSDVDPYHSGLPGRPTIAHLLLAELRRRAEAGLLEDTLAAQAKALRRWTRDSHPAVSTPSQNTIENSIRPIFWKLRGALRRTKTPK
jgi:hypothetical protein